MPMVYLVFPFHFSPYITAYFIKVPFQNFLNLTANIFMETDVPEYA